MNIDKIKNFQMAQEYILETPKFTKKNSLDATRAFYEKLGCPGEDKKIIHVAGTNGKGSVCAFTSQILSEAGKKVGLFTSPHLVSMSERFRIGGIAVDDKMFFDAFCFVAEKIEGLYHPTFFEFLFFIGMVLFERENVDMIVLETGLGGKLDATNVVAHKCVTAITKIGLDHTQYLGNTITEIAEQKAGIIKEKTPVVFFDYENEASDVIRACANKLEAPVYEVTTKLYKISKINDKSIDFSYKSRYYDYVELTLSSCAKYQVENAVIACTIIDSLQEMIPISREQLQSGIANTRWEGRMEEVASHIYVDGAHNEDGIAAFVEAVRDKSAILNEPDAKNYLIFSVVNDKAYDRMIYELTKDSLFSNIAVTCIGGERAMEPEVLRNIFMQNTSTEIDVFENAQDAVKAMCKKMREIDYLYIVGSLYLVGIVKQLEL